MSTAPLLHPTLAAPPSPTGTQARGAAGPMGGRPSRRLKSSGDASTSWPIGGSTDRCIRGRETSCSNTVK